MSSALMGIYGLSFTKKAEICPALPQFTASNILPKTHDLQVLYF